ncbi:hypothetical protein GCM10022252_12670 [Streptosporangium oxazolinicum]|uniref:Uncharacterized protein n=1 Tax=Streptosporangium oxazolinicum TaxID=909287 RepID=A0ABP8AHV0_9ACTN
MEELSDHAHLQSAFRGRAGGGQEQRPRSDRVLSEMINELGFTACHPAADKYYMPVPFGTF